MFHISKSNTDAVLLPKPQSQNLLAIQLNQCFEEASAHVQLISINVLDLVENFTANAEQRIPNRLGLRMLVHGRDEIYRTM
jgi:hypothetical protein